MRPTPELENRIARLLGTKPMQFVEVPGGYTPAARWVCHTEAGSVFVKFGTTPLTRAFLRDELRAYARVSGPFMPRLVAADADPDEPLLIIEDLVGHDWPPPWTKDRVSAALRCIQEVHDTSADLPTMMEAHGELETGWERVAADPKPFLSLGLASPEWLDGALPVLRQSASECPPAGNALLHLDIRSDNLCIRGDRAVLVDCNNACLGNAELDLGFWLPSLAYEGGPPPEAILPRSREVASFVAGFFPALAGQALIPDAPRVRLVQRQQLEVALPWAARALGLLVPSGC